MRKLDSRNFRIAMNRQFFLFCVLCISWSSQQQTMYTCEDVSARAEEVCAKESNRAGFSFDDGCNGITCLSEGGSASTMMWCEPPAADDEAGQAFCDNKMSELNRRLASSKRYTMEECLPAAKVCAGYTEADSKAGVNRAYFNGCNYCNCMDSANAVCTYMSCPAFYGTPAEFEARCVRAKTGVLNRDELK